MISVDIDLKATKNNGLRGFHESIKDLGTKLKVSDLADIVSTIMIGRVGKRFMRQENPDGTNWPVSRSAKIRMAGGHTYAEGGRYAPGGMKTAGNTLFSSGNLFHSIQLNRLPGGKRVISSNVYYASDYMSAPRIIIGINKEDVRLMSLALLARMRQ